MTLLKTAREAKLAERLLPPLPRSPEAFDGSLEEFFVRVIEPTLLPVEQVLDFHNALARYVNAPSPLFLLRAISATERRSDYQAGEGQTFRATDNAPAWWVYGTLSAGHRIDPECVDAVIRSIPCHMFDVPGASASVPAGFGWHIAHILNVNNRDADFGAWGKKELVRRFMRNVHPANYFLLPKQDWQRLGNDSDIVDFMARVYQDRYASIWPEFAELAGFDRPLSRVSAAGIVVRFGVKHPVDQVQAAATAATPSVDAERGSVAVSYRASRLWFKRDIIEPLAAGDRFRIETPIGDFEMTKADFHRVFPNVIASRSYREGGNYHWPSPPASADQFRL